MLKWKKSKKINQTKLISISKNTKAKNKMKKKKKIEKEKNKLLEKPEWKEK